MKKYLAVIMVAMAILLGIQLSMEHMFTEKRLETAPTMAEVKAAEEEKAEKTQEQEEMPEVFAIFGVDADEGDAGRSDCILLMSFEQESGTLRMCSIARDTMVTIPGEGTKTKLGHAYSMGGPEKAMETLNENFDLNIQHYVSVNFSQMADIVDLMGGVEVQLTQAEWNYMGLGEPYLGAMRLNGEKALQYCRIRSIDSDDVRTSRQRTLIASMLGHLQDVPRARLPELLADGIKMCRTNIRFGELLWLGKTVLSVRSGVETVSMALPGDSVNAWGGIREDGIWYYVYDLHQAADVMNDFFFGENAQKVLGDM